MPEHKKTDFFNCLNISFFIYILMILAFIIFLAGFDCYRKSDIIMRMTYVQDAEETTYINTLITADAFSNANTTAKSPLTARAGHTDDKSYTRLAKAGTREIPVNYTELNYPGMDIPIYTFIDEDGASQYRMFSEREINGSLSKGYIIARQKLEGLKIAYEYDLESDFIDTKNEKYGYITPADAPAEAATGLTKVFGYTGLYYKENGDTKEYYIYGSYKNREPGFFIANNSGNMIPGTLPVDLKDKETEQ